jgi:aryl-alcohol dehydrogenase-like predicted oxidoreductase
MGHESAKRAGQFKIGGEIEINRLGFGAMRITGRGIWGEPADPAEAVRTLRRLPELGVDFVDTADSYGPEVSERLIYEALFPYQGILIATKGGFVRNGPDSWVPLGRPEYLRQCVLMSLRRLRLERIGLWQLHRIDSKVPEDEQFDAVRSMQKEGLIQHIGLSKVSVKQIAAARSYFTVATVQNPYNLIDRTYEDVVNFCATNEIGFIPYRPLAAGSLARPRPQLQDIARNKGVTSAQVAVAWTLQRSPIMLPIPGTSTVRHLEENVASGSIQLSAQELESLNDIE